MSDTVIELTGISKRYFIGAKYQAAPRLRDLFTESLQYMTQKIWRRGSLPGVSAPDSQEFWALRDVSFEVKRGQVLGVLGHNGAGKSTLLKILSRITAPTSGKFRIKGRVVSLLEVGTGFHQELTGRENIYLNGAILGMTHAEIRKKFDQIVDFSEIGDFLDTPVKFYSSGMYTRLAFAVGANLEPEIFILDEVLAVGDARFQKKCMERIHRVAQEGRTVLFVSHNTGAVQRFCPRSILLEQGQVVANGETTQVLARYLGTHKNQESGGEGHRNLAGHRRLLESRETPPIQWTDISIVNSAGKPTLEVVCGEALEIRLGFQAQRSLGKSDHVEASISLHHLTDPTAMICGNDMADQYRHGWPREGVLICKIPQFPLSAGTYYVNLNLSVNGRLSDQLVKAAFVNVHPGDFFRTGKITPVQSSTCLVPHSWELQPREAAAAAA